MSRVSLAGRLAIGRPGWAKLTQIRICECDQKRRLAQSPYKRLEFRSYLAERLRTLSWETRHEKRETRNAKRRMPNAERQTPTSFRNRPAVLFLEQDDALFDWDFNSETIEFGLYSPTDHPAGIPLFARHGLDDRSNFNAVIPE